MPTSLKEIAKRLDLPFKKVPGKYSKYRPVNKGVG